MFSQLHYCHFTPPAFYLFLKVKSELASCLLVYRGSPPLALQESSPPPSCGRQRAAKKYILLMTMAKYYLKRCQYSMILCRNVPAVLFDPSVKCSLYEYLLKETILVFTNMGVKMFLCKTIMVRMYLIVFCLRYVQSLIVRVLYRMSFLMIIFGQNIP